MNILRFKRFFKSLALATLIVTAGMAGADHLEPPFSDLLPKENHSLTQTLETGEGEYLELSMEAARSAVENNFTSAFTTVLEEGKEDDDDEEEGDEYLKLLHYSLNLEEDEGEGEYALEGGDHDDDHANHNNLQPQDNAQKVEEAACADLNQKMSPEELEAFEREEAEAHEELTLNGKKGFAVPSKDGLISHINERGERVYLTCAQKEYEVYQKKYYSWKLEDKAYEAKISKAIQKHQIAGHKNPFEASDVELLQTQRNFCRIGKRPNTPPSVLGEWSSGQIKATLSRGFEKSTAFLGEVVASHQEDFENLKRDPLKPSNLLKAPVTLVNQGLGEVIEAASELLEPVAEKTASLARQELREVGVSSQAAHDAVFIGEAVGIATGVVKAAAKFSRAAAKKAASSTSSAVSTRLAKASSQEVSAFEKVTSRNLEQHIPGNNIKDKLRLRTKLAFEEAGFLDVDGRLTEYAVSKSEIIRLKDSVIGNPSIFKELTKDGSNILDWNKYKTPEVKMPNKQWREIHFYKHEPTGTIDMNTVDFKVKGDILP